MAIVIFKDVERILQEGGDRVSIDQNGGFYDGRVYDSLTISMRESITSNKRRFSKYKITSDNFNPPENFLIKDEDWNWYGIWVKMYIPNNFKVKRGL